MSLPITSYTLNIDNSWALTWAPAGAASYRIVLYGTEVGTSSTGSFTLKGFGQSYRSFPPPVEVVPVGSLALSETFTPFLVAQWYGENVYQYLVQQFTNSSWKTIANVSESGQWLYTFISPVLLDETTYQYRVIAVDSVGNQSTPRQYQRYVVTPPVPPDGQVVIGYSKPNITVTAVS